MSKTRWVHLTEHEAVIKSLACERLCVSSKCEACVQKEEALRLAVTAAQQSCEEARERPRRVLKDPAAHVRTFQQRLDTLR